jgi:ATP-dependent DNA helicase HFM1/MER3
LHLRIVGVSATLPNISSIAAFLDAKEAYSFDASYRPVPLQTHVVGLGWAGKNAFMFAKGLDRHVPDLIKRFSRSKATIVFCHTKKETETLAMELAKVPGIGLPNNGGNMTLASQTKLTVLQGSLLRGIAYHHAGLDASDRKLVETAFMNGKVLVLCATSTLAMGVNLPAHLVVIKGTSAWRGSGQGHQEIDTGTLLQMIGRAGRPGFDTSGTAVIMTDNASKPKYEKLSGGMEVVESQLPPRLMEVMNTEISQRVITSFEAAMNWIKSTFFFRRAMENPQQYGLSSSKSDIEEFMEKNCLDSLERLSKEGIIAFDESGRIEPKAACHIMSQSLVDFESMTRIVSLPFDATSEALLKMLVECDRLHYPVRRSEKKALNETHKLIRYKLDGPPSKVRIQTPTEKAFVLLQAAIGQQYLEDYTLRQEMSHMSEYASRLLKATEECSIEGSLNGHVALQSLRLRRSLATSLWGPGDGVLNQLRGVGHKTTAKLRFSKILSFVDVLSSSSEEIERAAGREAPFGKELRIAVSKILKNTLQLSACVESEEDDLKFVICSLGRRRALPGIENVECDESAGIVNYTLVVFTDRPGGSLVFQPNISTVGEYRLPCPPKCGKIFVHLVASMVGLDGKQGKKELLFVPSPVLSYRNHLEPILM